MISSSNESDNFSLSNLLDRDNLVDVLSSLDFLGSFLSHDLDVDWVGHVRGDSSLGSVGSSSSLLSLVHLHVGDDEFLQIQLLGLGVVLEVLQEREQVLDGLLGPGSLGLLELGGLSLSSDTVGVLGERDDSLVLEDILEVLLDFLDGLSLHHLGGLPGSLEIDLDVVAAGSGVLLIFWVLGVVGHRL